MMHHPRYSSRARACGRWMLVLLLWSIACSRAGAQQDGFPPSYRRLRTPEEKILLLRQQAALAIRQQQCTQVPLWIHTALGLLRTLKAQDTLSPLLYQLLGDAYDGRQNDSAAYYYRRSLSSFRHPGIVKQLYLQQSLLYAFMALEQQDSIQHYTHELERTVAALPDTSSYKLSAYNAIALGYGAVSQYPQAVKAYRFVIVHALERKDTATLRNALINTGTAYNEVADDRLAAYYTLQALPYLGKDQEVRLTACSNLAGYFQSLGRLDSARYFQEQAEAIVRVSGDAYMMHSIALRRASILILEQDYPQAERLLRRSLAFFEKEAPGLALINCLTVYATLDTAMNNYAGANRHLHRLYDITRTMSSKVYRMESLRMLAFVNERLGNYKEAYQYQKDYTAIRDAIKADETAQGIAALQTEYQAFRKEEQIRLLQRESRIKDLELAAAWRNRVLLVIAIAVLMAAFAFILYHRSQRGRHALRHLKAELEMKSLRSQMNPHFIFNSLNSIQKYIWENQQEDAAAYLTRFARLIRLVLENSQHAMVSLRQELAALRLYIDMECVRSNQKFSYRIDVEEGLDTDSVQVPPLLLQPYVENAIWHGLSPKDGEGSLLIRIRCTASSLICTIDDNGIGRAMAAVMKSGHAGKAPLGMNISSQRIEWLQRATGAGASVDVIDKMTGTRPTGTCVILTLPLKRRP